MPANVKASSLIVGNPFGEEQREDEARLLAEDRDGRTIALTWFKKYLCEQVISVSGDQGQKPMRITLDPANFFLEPPPSLPDGLKPIAVGIEPGEPEYKDVGMGETMLAETHNVYRPNTVVKRVADYHETFKMIFVCANAPQRRAVKKMIEHTCIPTEAIMGIRFKMPDYYDQTATFVFENAMLDDSLIMPNGRYDLDVSFLLYMDFVRLVYVNRFEPTIQVEMS